MEHKGTKTQRIVLLVIALLLTGTMSRAVAQTTDTIAVSGTATPDTDDDDDIWRKVKLGELDFKKARNHCVRLYAYYRYTDDGEAFIGNRQQKLYRVYEGICQLDIRYNRDEDDGADIIVGRDLVHPDRPGHFMDFYELKPYTFLEKARRDPKRYTMTTAGDTTRVYTKLGLAGTAVRDTARQELHMSYNALSPDTAYSINLLILKARLSNVLADAVYRLDDNEVSYVPQGNLKRVVFDGDIVLESPMTVADDNVTGDKGPTREVFREHTEIYVDSVVYMTRDEYRAVKKQSMDRQRQQSGYTVSDIDRLRQKLGVPPLSAEQKNKIEDQRDWDDQYELWKKTEQKLKPIKQ